jgi:hypothetical protein
MGAWGAGNFDNDDAGDWSYELEESGIEAVKSAFDMVLSGEDYVEAPECSAAIAAAEVVAALLGRPAADLPEEVQTFVSTKPKFATDLVELAKKALVRVLADNSELRELWQESDSFDEWKQNVADVQARLAG